jgi:hypothetical protein
LDSWFGASSLLIAYPPHSLIRPRFNQKHFRTLIGDSGNHCRRQDASFRRG